MRPEGAAERVYCALVRFMLPKEVVTQFGDQILRTFRRLRDEARERRGFTGVCGVWTREVWQMASTRGTYRSPHGAPSKSGLKGRPTIGVGWMFDLRQVWRSFWRRPAEALTVIITLALGIGSSTAIFSVARAVLLTPLPFEDPGRVVRVGDVRGTSKALLQTSVPNFLDWADLPALSDLAASWDRPDIFFGGAFPEQITNGRISSTFLDVAGVHPILGRVFTPEEGATAAPVAIISYAFWQAAFGGDPGVVGRSIRLDSGRYTLVGVLGPEVGGLSFPPFDRPVLTPFNPVPTETWRRSVRFLRVLGRLAPGVSLDVARADADALGARLAAVHPESNAGRGIGVVPIRDALLGDARALLIALGGGSALLLLIACANTAGVLTGRALTRRSEMAVRHALGANRGRLLRLGLLEGLVLALASFLVGVVLSAGIQRALLALAPQGIPRIEQTGSAPAVLAFAAAVSFVTAVACSLGPVLGVSSETGTISRSHGRATVAASRAREALIAGEVAFALVLVIAGGVLGSSLWRLSSVDPGYESGGVVGARVSLPTSTYPTEVRPAFFRSVIADLEAVSGIQRVATSTFPVLSTGSFGVDFWRESDRAGERGSLWPVSAGYFATMGIGVEEGRVFTRAEDADGTPVIVIGRSAAKQLFGEASPLGESIRFESHLFTQEPARRIIGVVEDVRHFGLDNEPTPQLYVPHGQFPGRSPNIHVKSTLPSEAVVGALRDVISNLDRSLPIQNVSTLDQTLARSLAYPRFSAFLLIGFAVAGIVLIAVGVFSVVAYSVARRLKEAGIRMALGARESDVLRLFLWTGMGPSLVGAAIGLTAQAYLSRVLAGISANAPPARMAAALVGIAIVLGVALLACLGGARRAAKTQPRDVLAAE
jgi:predicted permease